MVPKGERAQQADVVRPITAAKSSRDRASGSGRADSVGYDPEAGEEHGSRYTTKKARDHETDVFTLVESKGYSEDRFYCKSVNADGHGEKLQTRVPQGIDSQMHAAVAVVPEYKSLQDLIRDAVVHRLEYIQKRYTMSEAARRVLELERIQADATRAAQEIDVMTEAVAAIEARCAKAWEAKDWMMLADQMEKASETIDWLRDPYKTQASEILRAWQAKGRVHIQRMQRQLDE